MIIVTGPGRSGTSALAALYKQLGFDPGGQWLNRGNAGLEAPPIVSANEEIIRQLGLVSPAAAAPASLVRLGRCLPPLQRLTRVTYARLNAARVGRTAWSRLDRIVRDMGPRLVQLARTITVAKDPRFLFTIGVWAAAGADIEHCLLTMRSLDAASKSRLAVGFGGSNTSRGVRHNLVYGAGMFLFSVIEREIDWNVVRFPNFLDEPRLLYESMRFPQPVSWPQFEEAFKVVMDVNLVRFGY